MFDSLKSLAQRFKKTHAFFSQENLENLILKYDQHVALLVIDVQKEFCDPAGRRGNGETEEISGRIQSIVPAFRKAGVPVYAVYFSRNGEKIRKKSISTSFNPRPKTSWSPKTPTPPSIAENSKTSLPQTSPNCFSPAASIRLPAYSTLFCRRGNLATTFA